MGKVFKVLLVEDEKVMARVLERAFENPPKGYRFDVEHVRSLTSAKDLMDRFHYHMMLLDLYLLDASPEKTLKCAIEEDWASKTSLSIMTGYDLPEVRELTKKLGKHTFTPKSELQIARLANRLIEDKAHHTRWKARTALGKVDKKADSITLSLQRLASV